MAPNPKLSLAANFLYMMSGKKPTELASKTFDVALILHADHEFNASTFAARVTAATLSDVHSAVVSGIGALKGPLHGGANEQVMLMVEKIKDPAKAEAWIRKAIADKMRHHGLRPPRLPRGGPAGQAPPPARAGAGPSGGQHRNVEILETVARVVSAEKHIFPNVDLFSGAAYSSMGIPTDQFTPIFAMSRVAGWAAHVLEQHGNNRLIRPRAEYTGALDLKYVPAGEPVGAGRRPRRGRARRRRRAPERGAGGVQPALPHPRLSREPRAPPRALRALRGGQRLQRRDRGVSPPLPLAYPLRYQRSAENVGLIRALNAGARLAGGEFLCFLHNDTEIRDGAWLARLRDAVVGRRPRGAGRPLRRAAAPRATDATWAAPSCRAWKGAPPPPAPVTEVAAVDGVCLFLRRALLAQVGGFDEGYGFFHGYDRELSFAVREVGQRLRGGARALPSPGRRHPRRAGRAAPARPGPRRAPGRR